MNLEIHEARRAGSSLAQAARPGYRCDGMSAACRAALLQLLVH
jgi:hypothetical protein